MNKTLDYYNKFADTFVNNTVNVNFTTTQDIFLSYLEDHAYILDFGCGAGRDTKYFLDHGYKVDAIDGSKELCKYASKYTGIDVKCMLFDELDDKEKYDAVWACASILHLSYEELVPVLNKMKDALVHNGIIYTSFKYSTFEGIRDGRYYTDMTEATLDLLLQDVTHLVIIKEWISEDVRDDRNDKWLNIILRKE